MCAEIYVGLYVTCLLLLSSFSWVGMYWHFSKTPNIRFNENLFVDLSCGQTGRHGKGNRYIFETSLQMRLENGILHFILMYTFMKVLKWAYLFITNLACVSWASGR